MSSDARALHDAISAIRKCAFALLFLAGSAPFLYVAPAVIKYRYGLFDAVCCQMLDFPGSTDWAPGFTESKFSSISIGDKKETVFSILGAPIATWRCGKSNEYLMLVYAGKPASSSTHYNRRVIRMENGKVSEKIREFYVD